MQRWFPYHHPPQLRFPRWESLPQHEWSPPQPEVHPSWALDPSGRCQCCTGDETERMRRIDLLQSAIDRCDLLPSLRPGSSKSRCKYIYFRSLKHRRCLLWQCRQLALRNQRNQLERDSSTQTPRAAKIKRPPVKSPTPPAQLKHPRIVLWIILSEESKVGSSVNVDFVEHDFFGRWVKWVQPNHSCCLRINKSYCCNSKCSRWWEWKCRGKQWLDIILKVTFFVSFTRILLLFHSLAYQNQLCAKTTIYLVVSVSQEPLQSNVSWLACFIFRKPQLKKCFLGYYDHCCKIASLRTVSKGKNRKKGRNKQTFQCFLPHAWTTSNYRLLPWSHPGNIALGCASDFDPSSPSYWCREFGSWPVQLHSKRGGRDPPQWRRQGTWRRVMGGAFPDTRFLVHQPRIRHRRLIWTGLKEKRHGSYVFVVSLR